MSKPFQYKLDEPEQEATFRSSRLAQDKRQLTLICCLAGALMCVFLPLDYLYMRAQEGLVPVLAARVMGIAAIVVCIALVRRSKDGRSLDRSVFACELLVIAHIALINEFQHADPISIAAWDIVVIFALYILIPVRFGYQVACAWALTAGSFYTWIAHTAPSLEWVESLATPLAYLGANLFGALFSLNLNRVLRHEFQLLKTERALKSDLQQTNASLQESIGTRNRLFSVLAHDLRSTIGALGSIGRLLNSKTPRSEEERQNLLDLLCVGSKSSYDVLDNLLQWALSETGSIAPNLQPVPLEQAIQNSIDFLSVSASQKNIELRDESFQSLAAQADPQMLDTILRNLISNAIKFTHRGGSVSITQQQHDAQTATIIVEDNGVGIASKQLENLFQLDYGQVSVGTAGEKGSSLGLRICAEFAAKQGGRLWAESEAGRGSRFYLSLPLAGTA
ncbi:HAMP domain-containing sensor histidine kinase [Pelagicoccus sp. SDUM812003]|uniref:sensor histidine kinase n=1 Tax=Pelagicoccus sp. SDUM812003 TaxID=3041267 RepID=UPI00280CF5B9|nr:HAMP domain-containing sensor histidine kinase [Pelagicoccus sp. SDUM812003]MDQ8204758.1 HAMP domain-containing sensor histidine kinase [Pelagicoccus sp. SDUM812003]